MKVGDKVKVIKLQEYDIEDTNLKVGDIGIITNEFQAEDELYDRVFDVKFYIDLVCVIGCMNLNEDGSYNMYESQLEVI